MTGTTDQQDLDILIRALKQDQRVVEIKWGLDSGGGGMPGALTGHIQTVTPWDEICLVKTNGFAAYIGVHRVTAITDQEHVYFER